MRVISGKEKSVSRTCRSLRNQLSIEGKRECLPPILPGGQKATRRPLLCLFETNRPHSLCTHCRREWNILSELVRKSSKVSANIMRCLSPFAKKYRAKFDGRDCEKEYTQKVSMIRKRSFAYSSNRIVFYTSGTDTKTLCVRIHNFLAFLRCYLSARRSAFRFRKLNQHFRWLQENRSLKGLCEISTSCAKQDSK